MLFKKRTAEDKAVKNIMKKMEKDNKEDAKILAMLHKATELGQEGYAFGSGDVLCGPNVGVIGEYTGFGAVRSKYATGFIHLPEIINKEDKTIDDYRRFFEYCYAGTYRHFNLDGTNKIHFENGEPLDANFIVERIYDYLMYHNINNESMRKTFAKKAIELKKIRINEVDEFIESFSLDELKAFYNHFYIDDESLKYEYRMNKEELLDYFTNTFHRQTDWPEMLQLIEETPGVSYEDAAINWSKESKANDYALFKSQGY